MNKVKRLVLIAMLLAMAVVLSYVESFIPLFVPGVKLGLANVIILIMLYEFKFYEALIVDLLRILLVSIIIGSFLNPVFYMSLSGGIVSYIVMLIFTRIKVFSPIGTSVLGALGHAFGQVVVASILMSTDLVFYYLPFIAILSILTGILSGVITRIYLKRSPTKEIINSSNNEFLE